MSLIEDREVSYNSEWETTKKTTKPDPHVYNNPLTLQMDIHPQLRISKSGVSCFHFVKIGQRCQISLSYL